MISGGLIDPDPENAYRAAPSVPADSDKRNQDAVPMAGRMFEPLVLPLYVKAAFPATNGIEQIGAAKTTPEGVVDPFVGHNQYLEPGNPLGTARFALVVADGVVTFLASPWSGGNDTLRRPGLLRDSYGIAFDFLAAPGLHRWRRGAASASQISSTSVRAAFGTGPAIPQLGYDFLAGQLFLDFSTVWTARITKEQGHVGQSFRRGEVNDGTG